MPSLVFTKNLKGLYCFGNKTTGLIPSIIDKLTMSEAKEWCERMEPFLHGKKILDVGFGTGNLACYFARKGYEVEGIDVFERSIYEDLKSKVYDGTNFPYADNTFDTAFIVHTLHHCDDPIRVLSEAKRVAKRVIILEDTFRNPVEAILTAALDKILNFEFYPHKHQSPEGWESIIKNAGWKIVGKDEWIKAPSPTIYARFCLYSIE